jgi:mono/diheme cytochrome c family protein/plastocyanin
MRAGLILLCLLPEVALAAGPTIRGRVRYQGPAPTPAQVDPGVNPDVCGRKKPILSEQLVVGPEGALANVAVVLVGITERAPTRTPAQLTQRNCVFVPHVQTITAGSTIQISNDDPVVHNVHARLAGETLFNLGMPLAGTRLNRRLDRPGVVELSCDSGHVWMRASLIVVPHSYHATTPADGWFVIPDVTPGRYRLRAWHERLGVQEVEVVVEPERGAEVEIVFAAGPLLEEAPVLSFDLPATAVAPGPESEGEGAVELHPSGRTDRWPAERDAARAAGLGLYRQHCATCHGEAGDGAGESVPFLHDRPRNFTRGEFKFRSTRSGDLPTIEDLVRTLTVGIPGTEMPSFRRVLPPRDRAILARYVMSYSDRFARGPGVSIPIPEAPPSTPALIAQGQKTWVRLKCAQCHGQGGEADGVSKQMVDDFGHAITAPDLTRGIYKSGPEPKDLYRTLVTGLSGTPMPAFAELLGPDQLWALVHYLRSLAPPRPVSDLLGLP